MRFAKLLFLVLCLTYIKELIPWRNDQALLYYNKHFFNDQLPPIVINGEGEEMDEPLTAAEIKRTCFFGDGWRIEAEIVDEELIIRKVMD